MRTLKVPEKISGPNHQIQILDGGKRGVLQKSDRVKIDGQEVSVRGYLSEEFKHLGSTRRRLQLLVGKIENGDPVNRKRWFALASNLKKLSRSEMPRDEIPQGKAVGVKPEKAQPLARGKAAPQEATPKAKVEVTPLTPAAAPAAPRATPPGGKVTKAEAVAEEKAATIPNPRGPNPELLKLMEGAINE